MKAHHRWIAVVLLFVIGFVLVGARAAQVDRYVIPVTATVGDSTITINVTVGLANNQIASAIADSPDDIDVETGEIRYLGAVDNEPVPTPTPSVAVDTTDLETLAAQAQEYSHEDMVRRNRKLQGELVHIKGFVDGVANGLEDSEKRLEILFEEGEYFTWDWEKTVYADYSGDLRFVENDEVEVWGTLGGIEQDFMDNPHPIIDVVHVELLSTDPSVPVQCIESRNRAATASSPAELQEAAVSATAEDILRYFDDCSGAIVRLEGEVSSTEYTEEMEILDVSMPDEEGLVWNNHVVKAEYTGEEAILEEDVVAIIGQVQKKYDEADWTLDDFDSVQLRLTVLDITIE